MSKKSKKAESTPEETEIIQDTAVSEDAGTLTDDTVEAFESAPAEETVPAEEAPAEETAPAEEPQVTEETTGTVIRPVNFRTGTSFSRAVIAEIKAGTTVKIVGSEQGEKGTWYKCVFDGRTGYIKATGVNIAK